MRKFISFAAACLLACSLLLIAQPAVAASQAWIQADEINTLAKKEGSIRTYSFGIYDIHANIDGSADGSNSLELLTASYFDFFALYDIYENSGWYATEVDANHTPIGPVLSLTNEEFGFYVYDGSNYYWDYAFNGSGNIWTLDWTGNVTASIFASDVKPVPIPTAALLLGSGLIGLVGFRRRKIKD